MGPDPSHPCLAVVTEQHAETDHLERGGCAPIPARCANPAEALATVERLQAELGALREGIESPSAPLEMADRAGIAHHIQVIAGSLRCLYQAFRQLSERASTSPREGSAKMPRENTRPQLRTFAFLMLLTVLDIAWSYLAPLARDHLAGRLPLWSLYVLDHALRLAWMTALWTAFLIRLQIDTPNAESISIGPVIVQGIDNKSAFILQLPIYGHEPDGWPFDPVAFGLAVRSARTACGWSQVTLAKKANLTEQTVRAIERGNTASTQTRELLIAAFQDAAKSPETERTTP